MKLIFIVTLLFSLKGFAKFTKYEVTNLKRNKYSILKACKILKIKHVILAEEIDEYSFDCMGTKINTTDFCNKVIKNKNNLLRGFIRLGSKEITCQTASRAIISVVCDKRDMRYCYKATTGCNKVKRNYAANLIETHHSITEDENGRKQLNCYFSKKTDLNRIDSFSL